METLRKRWRLVLGIVLVLVAVAIGFLSDSVALQAGFTLFTFFALIVLIITGTKRGGGGTNPWHHQGGNTGNG